MTTLSNEEVNRYARHLILPEVGIDGQEKLKASSVLCIGAGGLGAPLTLYLAAAGVGRIGIVDFDIVEDSNLQRQVIHGTSTIGMSKLDSAKQRLLDLNPYIEIDCINERLDASNALDLFKQYDVVADGTDNFPTRYLVNDACVLTDTPNVYGSIFRFEGQISVFNYKNGPCYRCLYNEPPPPGLVPSCAEGGVLGVLPGVVGTLQATEVIKVLLGLGKVASERLLMFDALNLKFRDLKLRKDPHCVLCSDRATQTGLIDYEEFCGIPQQKAAESQAVDEISVHALKDLLDQKETLTLLDVREPNEHEICNIEDATLLPLSQVETSLDQFSKDQRIVIHCKSGVRSANAVRKFNDAGFKNVQNVSGGIIAWAKEIDPKMQQY